MTTPDGSARPRILAYAYQIEPDAGSEPGAGWASVRMLAGFADVTVVTRMWAPDASGTFDAWLERIPEPGAIRFVTVPLDGDPAWEGQVDRPAGRVRLERVRYVVWQLRARRVARRLHREEPFDLTWHLVWANAWLGSTLASVEAPFVLGPVGGAVAPPMRLAARLGPRGVAFEVARWASRSWGRWMNPIARRAWGRASLILVQNRETLSWLPRAARPRARVFNNATIEAYAPRQPRPLARPPTALFAARLVRWKGWRLAVDAIARTPDWRLIVCGDGPDRAAMEALVDRRGLRGRVEFRGWQERDSVRETMAREVDALLFPSLHDEAGFVVAEAVSTGLPVVCLDVGGPPQIAGGGVRPGGYSATVERLAAALRASLGRTIAPVDLGVDARRHELLDLLRDAGVLPGDRLPRE